MKSARLRIRNDPHSEYVEKFILTSVDQSLIDFVYVDSVVPGEAIVLVGDLDVDFDQPEDFASAKSVIEAMLARYWIRNLEFDVIHVADESPDDS